MVVKKKVNFCFSYKGAYLIQIAIIFHTQKFYIQQSRIFALAVHVFVHSCLGRMFCSIPHAPWCWYIYLHLGDSHSAFYRWSISRAFQLQWSANGCTCFPHFGHANMDHSLSQLHQSTPTKGFSRQGRRWFGDLMFGIPKLPFASSHLQLRRHPSKRAWGPPPARPRPPGLRNVCTLHFCQLWPKFWGSKLKFSCSLLVKVGAISACTNCASFGKNSRADICSCCIIKVWAMFACDNSATFGKNLQDLSQNWVAVTWDCCIMKVCAMSVKALS